MKSLQSVISACAAARRSHPPSAQRAGTMEALPALPPKGGSMVNDGPDYTPLLSRLPPSPDDDAPLLLACADPSPPGQSHCRCSRLREVTTRYYQRHSLCCVCGRMSFATLHLLSCCDLLLDWCRQSRSARTVGSNFEKTSRAVCALRAPTVEATRQGVQTGRPSCVSTVPQRDAKEQRQRSRSS